MTTVLVWVQHLLGSGHLRRAIELARALAVDGHAVTIASGGTSMPWAMPAGVSLVQLPAARAADETFTTIVDDAGNPVDDAWRGRRRDVLLALFGRLRPDLLVTEMFPFGRRGFAFELLPLLDAAARARPRCGIVCSVRDVLVSGRRPGRSEWMRDLCLARYDRVLVHGDERFIPFAATFPHADELGARMAHTGFLVAPAPADPVTSERAGVLVSAGGGAVGARLLATAIAARPLTTLANLPWTLVGGTNMSAEAFRTLEAAAGDGMTLVRHLDEFRHRLAMCRVSVSQAGYNTVAETLIAGTRMVLVPFGSDGEDEQALRARALAERGRAVVVEDAALTPATLARAVDAASTAAIGEFVPATDGAARSVAAIRSLFAERRA